MQNKTPRRDTRIRECLVKIIRKNNITDVSKVDFSMKIFDNISIGEIKEAIEAERKRAEGPYDSVAQKLLKDSDYFDPFTVPEKDGWKPINELLYTDLNWSRHIAGRSYFIWSPMEIWQMVVSRINSTLWVYGLKTTIKIDQQRYFIYDMGQPHLTFEAQIQPGEPGSTADGLMRPKGVNGQITPGAANIIYSSPKIEVDEKHLLLHQICKNIINGL